MRSSRAGGRLCVLQYGAQWRWPAGRLMTSFGLSTCFSSQSPQRIWNLSLAIANENSRCTLLMNHPVSVCVRAKTMIVKNCLPTRVFIKNLTNRLAQRPSCRFAFARSSPPPTQTNIFSNRLRLLLLGVASHYSPLTFLPLLLLAYLRRADVSPSPRWDYRGISHKSKERARRGFFSSFLGIRRPPTLPPDNPTTRLLVSPAVVFRFPPPHPVLPRCSVAVTNPKETHCGRVCVCV